MTSAPVPVTTSSLAGTFPVLQFVHAGRAVAGLNEPACETDERLRSRDRQSFSLGARGAGLKFLVGKPLMEVEVERRPANVLRAAPAGLVNSFVANFQGNPEPWPPVFRPQLPHSGGQRRAIRPGAGALSDFSVPSG
jgi:hypothetical protein